MMYVFNFNKERNKKIQLIPDKGPLKIQETTTFEMSSLTLSKYDSLLSETRGETFGFEHFFSDEKSKSYFFTTNKRGSEEEKVCIPMIFSNDKEDLKNMNLYFIQAERAMCFPFLTTSNDSVWDKIKAMLEKEKMAAKVFLQILIAKKVNDDWKEKIDEQYQQYLQGIDEPSNLKFIQKIQTKINEKYPDEWKTEPSEIEEVQNKLENDGFRVCFKLVVLHDDKKVREKVAEKILKVFKLSSDSHNKWGISQVISFRKESFINNLQFRRFPLLVGTNQILSKEELLPFLIFEKSYKDVIEEVKEDKKEKDEESSVSKKGILSKKLPLLDFLPNGKQTKEQAFNPNLIVKLNKALEKIGIINEGEELKFKDVKNGPTVQKVTLLTPKGLKLSKIKNSTKDIQSELGLQNLSFEQGEIAGSIAMKLPRHNREKVFLKDMVDTKSFKDFAEEKILPFLIGMSETGEPIYECLTRVKHLLVAGATGSGKSVWLNQLLLMLLLTKSPKELRLYLIDPKMVEFPSYSDFPHVDEVITEAPEANELLRKLTIEMDERYKKLNEERCRNIQQYNRKVKEPMPYIVAVVDEFADLIMMEQDIEGHIVRLAQKARACGIHLIIATQRPSVDVITGLIKSNLPSRICFSCSSVNDYRTVLSHQPPYVLLGRGDGIAQLEGKSDFIRFQGVLIADSDEETDEILEKLSEGLNKKWSSIQVSPLIQTEKIEENASPKETLSEKEKKKEKLKEVIAETGETRIKILQKMTKIRMNTLSDEFLPQLVEEGWLEAPNELSRSYKLLLSEEEREAFLNERKPDEIEILDE